LHWPKILQDFYREASSPGQNYLVNFKFQRMLQRIVSLSFRLFAFLFGITGFSQSPYQFGITKTTPLCANGSVNLSISGVEPQDQVTITWSTGQTGVQSLAALEEGDYSVSISINQDTIHKLDTTLYFTMDKPECPVNISRQFTPNGDGYNDLFYISNLNYYPNFELEIYNKWGQRVHHQKNSFTPWDGKWAGANVPDGTYYFVFFFDTADKNKLLKGDISILR
jgi:gliding motility-associated-like protein